MNVKGIAEYNKMEGFFSKKETQSKSRPQGKTLSCASCGLYTGVNSAKMAPCGEGRKRILIIGEAPGEIEDRKGMPWQGKAGRALRQVLSELGVDLFEDCVSINAVNCRPENNRQPSQYEVDCCRAVHVSKVLNRVKPNLILLLGSSAVQSFIGDRWQKDLGGIMKWRGFIIPDREYKCYVAPTFHPSYVERGDDEVRTIWKSDLQKALPYCDKKFPIFPKPDIQYIEDLSVLHEYNHAPEISFDYETTGIKPQGKGHRIVCAAVAVNQEKVFTFMMPKTRAGRQPLIDLFTNNSIGKMAHNFKFEDHWTTERLHTTIENWQWDSMIAAHLLDNRRGITGLKFQVYINFGIGDYSSEVESYLKVGKDGNAFNRLEDLLNLPDGKKKLLKYCALDAHYQFLLAKNQMEYLDYLYLPF